MVRGRFVNVNRIILEVAKLFNVEADELQD